LAKHWSASWQDNTWSEAAARTGLLKGSGGFFGHGNVGGLGQGIVEFAEQEGLRFLPAPEMSKEWYTLRPAFAKHRNRLATFACTTSIGPGANQHDHRRSHRHRESATSVASAQRLFCESNS